MNMIRLIAWREYMENVRTKGFWVTILIIPLIFIGMYFLQSALSNATPSRYFILIDQSGQYEDAVAVAIEREHQRRILQEFVNYLMENRKETDLELTAANASNAADQLVDDVDADEVAALDQWLENGGLDYAVAMASPYLRDDIEPFEQPGPQFIAADLPADIDAKATPEEIVTALRPYLTGEQDISLGSESGSLFALILIPENIDGDIARPGAMPAAPGTNRGVQYWARNLTDSRLPDAIIRSINAEIRESEYANLGVNTELVRNVQRTRMPISQLDPSAAAG
ncbi:MAG: hypothetical protein ISQ58_01250, partial [Pseudomonadales bacterium]|nr:hypothetical protein [Pseudomonadales bacterium]